MRARLTKISVAYKRFCDNVPQIVDQKLVQDFNTKIMAALREKLDVGSAERCAAWLAETPGLVEYRKSLQITRQRLEDAQRQLDVFRLS